MKFRILPWLLPLTLTGCAGYNHTLFMTKSNVGLDFDSKPPTLEISVARKEAVIAPTFEGGKTPPVMASFKPHAGTGNGFASFFLGADQTFAGGDAALAMSMLYDKATATQIEAYDSTIHLSEKPAYGDWFRKIPGKKSTRPLIFGTDTSFGLKAAWSGVGGQFPDTVRLGFNRKEFAWAPLSATQANNGNGRGQEQPVNVKMPAFLATIESRQQLETNGGARIQGLQYFATGDAATRLAMQQEVRKAMHARLDPNAEAYKRKFGKSAHPILRHMLASVRDTLDALPHDPIAVEHVRRLDNLEELDIPDSYRDAQITRYAFTPAAGGNPAQLEADDQFSSPLSKASRHVTQFLAVLQENVTALQQAAAVLKTGAPLKIKKGAAAPADLTADDKKEMAKQLAKQEKRLAELTDAVSTDRTVLAAFAYLDSLIAPK